MTKRTLLKLLQEIGMCPDPERPDCIEDGGYCRKIAAEIDRLYAVEKAYKVLVGMEDEP